MSREAGNGESMGVGKKPTLVYCFSKPDIKVFDDYAQAKACFDAPVPFDPKMESIVARAQQLSHVASDVLTVEDMRILLSAHNHSTGQGEYFLRGRKEFLLARVQHMRGEILTDEWEHKRSQNRVSVNHFCCERRVAQKRQNGNRIAQMATAS